MLSRLTAAGIKKIKTDRPNKNVVSVKDIFESSWDYIGSDSEKQKFGHDFHKEVSNNRGKYSGIRNIHVRSNNSATYDI